MSRPLVSAGMIAADSASAPRAQNLVARLGLREATGRRRYRASGNLQSRARVARFRRHAGCEGREISPKATMGYDALVITISSVTNDFGRPAPPDTPSRSNHRAGQPFQPRLVDACLRAQDQDAPVHPGQLHVAIIGARHRRRARRGIAPFRSRHHRLRVRQDRPGRDLRMVLIEAGTGSCRSAAAHLRIDP